MQIFHWHFKSPKHQPKGDHNNSHNKEARGDIVEFKESKRDNRRRSDRRKLKAFTSLCRQDMATACFYSTLNLKSIHSNSKKEHWIYRMKKQDKINNVGNKVLPVNTTTMSNSTTAKVKSAHKVKAVSKMKELLRWVAASKSDTKSKFLGTSKDLQLRNKAERKAMKDENGEENNGNESAKTRNRWEVGRCSVCSSMASIEKLSLNSSPRRGNWITTDSEFVVLEL